MKENFEAAENLKKETISAQEKEALRREAERIKVFAEKRIKNGKETENIELVGINLDELCDKDWRLYAISKGWEQVKHKEADAEFRELQDFRVKELYPHLAESANEQFEKQQSEIGEETAKTETRLPAEMEDRPGSGATRSGDSRQKFYEWITHQWVKQTADIKREKMKLKKRAQRKEKEAQIR